MAAGKNCVLAATVLDPIAVSWRARPRYPLSCPYRTRPAAFCSDLGRSNFPQNPSAALTKKLIQLLQYKTSKILRGGLRPFRPLSRNSNSVVGGIALRELPSAVRSKLNLIMERNARGAFKNLPCSHYYCRHTRASEHPFFSRFRCLYAVKYGEHSPFGTVITLCSSGVRTGLALGS